MKFMHRMINKYFTKPVIPPAGLRIVEYCRYCGEYIMIQKPKIKTISRT